MSAMDNLDKVCKFLSNGEACPYGSACEYSHDIFQDDQLKILSKQLDAIIGGMSYLDKKMISIENTMIQFKREQEKTNSKIYELTEKVSILSASCRTIGIPLTSGTSWAKKVMVDPARDSSSDLFSRATCMEQNVFPSAIYQTPPAPIPVPQEDHIPDLNDLVDIALDDAKDKDLDLGLPTILEDDI